MLDAETVKSISQLCYWVIGYQIYEYLVRQTVLATASIVYTVMYQLFRLSVIDRWIGTKIALV